MYFTCAVSFGAEEGPRSVLSILVALRFRLAPPIVGDEEQDAAVERLRTARRGKRDREPQCAAVLRAQRDRADRGQHKDHARSHALFITESKGRKAGTQEGRNSRSEGRKAEMTKAETLKAETRRQKGGGRRDALDRKSVV